MRLHTFPVTLGAKITKMWILLTVVSRCWKQKAWTLSQRLHTPVLSICSHSIVDTGLELGGQKNKISLGKKIL